MGVMSQKKGRAHAELHDIVGQRHVIVENVFLFSGVTLVKMWDGMFWVVWHLSSSNGGKYAFRDFLRLLYIVIQGL